MADDKVAGAPALDTNIESGNFDEKRAQQQQQHAPPAGPAPLAKKVEADDDEDEDIDALIEDLESQDGHGVEEEEEDEGTPGGGRIVPEDMLQTDSRVGLTESEVVARRRKYGLNQMKEEKENLILKFFGYFIGPIQFVMEVSLCDIPIPCPPHAHTHAHGHSLPCASRCAAIRMPICYCPLFAFFARFFLRRRRLPAPHELGWAASNWLTTLAGSMWGADPSDTVPRPRPAPRCLFETWARRSSLAAQRRSAPPARRAAHHRIRLIPSASHSLIHRARSLDSTWTALTASVR